ncbi:MAG: methyltransferase [Spirochaetaceae bacterium]|jgi:hypothetical protein|nr:methyltransferase [Spirochaetaceae bacterium]
MEGAQAYITKSVDFKFRGKGFSFALSQGLFSAAAIDRGTEFLLKVLSRQWDAQTGQGLPLPKTVLDAGCGVGVIGVCVAGALWTPDANLDLERHVHCQDRDELATVITRYNARQNHIPEGLLSSHTEPLLAGPPHARWDLILSNIPAKAGEPVLRDFIVRSAALLNPKGSVLVVVVAPLGDFFYRQITQANLSLQYDELGKRHRVFMYGPSATPSPPVKPVVGGGYLLRDYPMYHRRQGEYILEDLAYSLDTIQGAADFNTPSQAVQVAAKLVRRLPSDLFQRTPLGSILIYEPGQGHFPRWLLAYLAQNRVLGEASSDRCWVLFGRNILALEASRYALSGERVLAIPGLDLAIDHKRLKEALRPEGYGFDLLVGFPQFVPQTKRLIPLWEGLGELLSPRGLAIIALPASEAERFDRKKPLGFTRLGDCKRKGFRALAICRA